MWRKQDESKASASSSEVVVPAKAEPTVVTPVTSVAHAPAAPATLARESSYSAGHLTGGIKIKGEITGREDLLIDGEVHGQIRISDARVTIGSNGRLTANVEAREIMVRGKVKGDLHARDRVQIGPSGGVIGDVVTRFLSVEEGAEIRGNVDTTRGEERPAARVKTGAASTPEARPVPMQARGQSKESTQSA